MTSHLPATVTEAFARQAHACRELGSPFTALLCEMLSELLSALVSQDSRFLRRLRSWPGDPVADALALRAAGGLHALARGGRLPGLTAAYPPHPTQPDRLQAALAEAIEKQDAFLHDYLDSPPQTNEVARSAVLLGGCLAIAARTWQRLEILEIGASAGLNLAFDRYRFALGRESWGRPDAPLQLQCDWQGDHPSTSTAFEIVARAGCDKAPLVAADPRDRERLLSYIWADQRDRLERTQKALELAAAGGSPVAQADAADWTARRLARPRKAGVVRVLLHTVVWQYLPEDKRARIIASLTRAGREATAQTPLAWLRMESDGGADGAAVDLSLWPEGRSYHLGRADFHGRWFRWAPASR